MPDVAAAIDTRAVPVTRRSEGAGGSWVAGEWVAAPETTATISAAVFPASGEVLRDLPEGERADAVHVLYTRAEVLRDDIIEWQGANHRVTTVKHWTHGGFYEALLTRS